MWPTCRITFVVYRKISQTLSYLEYICSLSSRLRDLRERAKLKSLNREDSDKYTLTITKTNNGLSFTMKACVCTGQIHWTTVLTDCFIVKNG